MISLDSTVEGDESALLPITIPYLTNNFFKFLFHTNPDKYVRTYNAKAQVFSLKFVNIA